MSGTIGTRTGPAILAIAGANDGGDALTQAQIKAYIREDAANRVTTYLAEHKLAAPRPEDRAAILGIVDEALERWRVRAAQTNQNALREPAAFRQELDDHFNGLGKLERLIKDPTVEEIRCNGPRRILVVRHGQVELVPDIWFASDDELPAGGQEHRRAVRPPARRERADGRRPDARRVAPQRRDRADLPDRHGHHPAQVPPQGGHARWPGAAADAATVGGGLPRRGGARPPEHRDRRRDRQRQDDPAERPGALPRRDVPAHRHDRADGGIDPLQGPLRVYPPPGAPGQPRGEGRGARSGTASSTPCG